MNTSVKFGIADQVRRFRYLTMVELLLDQIPGKRRRAILGELRTNIDEAAAHGTMSQALTDLGTPRALARGYLDVEPAGRPNWTAGALAAGVVVAAWLFGTLLYTVGMFDALQSTGGGTADGSVFGVQVHTEASAGGFGAEFDGFSWPVLVAVVLTFAITARAWRVFTSR